MLSNANINKYKYIASSTIERAETIVFYQALHLQKRIDCIFTPTKYYLLYKRIVEAYMMYQG